MKYGTILSLLTAVVLFLPTPARAQVEADIEGRWEAALEVEATFENGVLILVVPELAAGFGGTFTEPDRIEGLWERAGTRTPLELRRSEET